MGRNVRCLLILVAVLTCACGPTSVLESPASLPTPSLPTAAPLPAGTTAPTATGGSPATAAPSLIVATLTVALPAGLSRAVAFVDGTTVLVAGGLTRAGTTKEVLELDLANGRVAVVGHLADAVHDAGGADVSGSPMVFGGGNVSPVGVVQLARTGPGEVVGRLPVVRADLVAVELAGAAIVVGGGTPARLDRAVLATTDGIHFRQIATLRVGVRYPAVTVVGGSIFCIGGTDGSNDLTDIQVIDPATGTVRVIGHLPHGLSHASALVIAGHLIVAGGRLNGVAQDAIWEIDPTTGAATLAGRLPRAVSDMAAFVTGGSGYLVGGESDKPLASIVSIGFD